MHSFIFKRQPKSYNSGFKSTTSKLKYIEEIKTCVEQFNTVETLLTKDLYGIVYYFHKKNTGTDADNISKPLWDLLKGILFSDDNQVKLRIAGSIDILKGDLTIINFSTLKGEIIAELLEALETQDHVVYVECGVLNNDMYKFNLTNNNGN